jgi:hypothetical protein
MSSRYCGQRPPDEARAGAAQPWDLIVGAPTGVSAGLPYRRTPARPRAWFSRVCLRRPSTSVRTRLSIAFGRRYHRSSCDLEATIGGTAPPGATPGPRPEPAAGTGFVRAQRNAFAVVDRAAPSQAGAVCHSTNAATAAVTRMMTVASHPRMHA